MVVSEGKGRIPGEVNEDDGSERLMIVIISKIRVLSLGRQVEVREVGAEGSHWFWERAPSTLRGEEHPNNEMIQKPRSSYLAVCSFGERYLFTMNGWKIHRKEERGEKERSQRARLTLG